MWSKISSKFSRQRVRVDIARKMIECGMSVGEDNKLYVGDVEVDYTAVANVVDVDRRVVKQTVEQIMEDEFLRSIFPNLKPFGPSLVPVVSKLGYSAIVIEANPKSAGVMAAVTRILAENNIVIRQALAEDPDMVPDAKMTLVIEGNLPGEAISKIRNLDQIKSVKILK